MFLSQKQKLFYTLILIEVNKGIYTRINQVYLTIC